MKDSLKDIIREVNGIPRGEAPNLLIRWKPWEDPDYQVKYTDILMGLERPEVKAGETLVWMWDTVASIPCCDMTEDGIHAEDEAGELALRKEAGNVYGFPTTCWMPERDTVGSVALTYRFYPRVVPHDYRFRPYYDFRNEKNGATTTGVVTLAAPPKDQVYHVCEDWDLSEMPTDTRAVSIRGEGRQEYDATPDEYRFTMSAVGRISEHIAYDGQVRIYWLNEPLPDRERILRALPAIYKGLADFFEDSKAPYTIFFRKDPFEMSNGATAFTGGFVYGYSDEKPLNLDRALDIFAHETIHTWPHIEDTHGEGTWYHEGTAELYNILIPYRCGQTDLDFAAFQVTLRGINYYSNKYINMPNEEAWPLYWQDREAQWLPYGRGFFYFVDIDYRLHKASGGKKRLDDLVLEMEHRRRNGESYTIREWEDMIRRELGESEVERFRGIMNGAFIEPSEEWFDGAFTISRGTVTDPVRGTVRENAYIWTKKPGVEKADL